MPEPGFSLEIDGSTQYLGVKIPPGEHPLRTEALELLKRSGFQLDALSRVWRLRDRHRVLAFLAEHDGTLRRHFHARFAPEFSQRTAALSAARLTTNATEETAGAGTGAATGFRFSARIEAPGADEKTLHLALSRNQPYVETPDGKIILFPPEVLAAAAALAQVLHPGENTAAPAARISRLVSTAHFADLENTLESLSVPFTPPEKWRERSAALRNPGALREAPVEPALNERLRLYQKIGTAWLWHLYRNGLGGVLADEMGLGKTVQALAFLTALANTNATATTAAGGNGGAAVGIAPALIVCPASLLENWCREAARFAPALPVHRHHGPARAKTASGLPVAGIIVTSYGTLTRDTALFREREWAVILADEAQHIKNRRSQNAQSLRALRAPARFVLTGTPIENSLDDLRSLFAFLMPGYLETPPASASREQRQWLDKRTLEKVSPYILRRAKQAVAPELPAKIEQTVFVELDGAQEKLYREYQERSRTEIFEMEMSGASEGRVRVAALNHLLRLRQICAEPRLLDPALAAVDSAKLRALREILDEALDGGHRLLVFSQFVEVLRHLRGALQEDGIPCCYLDGATRERQAACDRFNADATIPVFLISLKAGGVGLNLTGADTVVHFDPWWNPAVEAQATDRAHRIGQRRVVTSLRLIAAGTVEERVLALQREKASLLRELFEGSAAATAGISLAELKAVLGGEGRS
jgi:SNF2 family DNA or RNA helicase